jgi:hypothetical protein
MRGFWESELGHSAGLKRSELKGDTVKGEWVGGLETRFTLVRI